MPSSSSGTAMNPGSYSEKRLDGAQVRRPFQHHAIAGIDKDLAHRDPVPAASRW